MGKLTSKLWRAMLSGNYHMAARLISKGANVNEPRNTDMDPAETLLHYASREKDVKLMNMLINAGANCRACDSGNFTPLHWATSGYDDRPDVVELLINEGAIVDARDDEQCTPLHLAVMHNCHQTAELLIAKGASIEAVDKEGRCALHYANEYQEVTMMKLLISHKININVEMHISSNFYSHTALQYAAIKGHTKKVRLLLDNGADLNKKQNLGEFALSCATLGHRPDIVHLLLERGARINEVNNEGNTALHRAIMFEYKDIAALLVQFGADMNLPNHEGKTVFHLLQPNKPSVDAIARIIIQEAVKREALGQPVCEGYRQMIQSCEKYSKYDQDFHEEIKSMRSKTINVEGNAITFFYIFSKNEVELSALARNKNIVTAFETSDYLALFKNYSSDLTKKFEKAKRRAHFIMSVEDYLVDGLGDILPVLILRKIATYVECIDVVESRYVELWNDYN